MKKTTSTSRAEAKDFLDSTIRKIAKEDSSTSVWGPKQRAAYPHLFTLSGVYQQQMEQNQKQSEKQVIARNQYNPLKVG